MSNPGSSSGGLPVRKGSVSRPSISRGRTGSRGSVGRPSASSLSTTKSTTSSSSKKKSSSSKDNSHKGTTSSSTGGEERTTSSSSTGEGTSSPKTGLKIPTPPTPTCPSAPVALSPGEKLRVGLLLPDKKLGPGSGGLWQGWAAGVADARGLDVRFIDLAKPLREQLSPLHVLLHKLTDVAAAARAGDEESAERIRQVVEITNDLPHLVVVDNLASVEPLLARDILFSTLATVLKLPSKWNVRVPPSVLLTPSSSSSKGNFPEEVEDKDKKKKDNKGKKQDGDDDGSSSSSSSSSSLSSSSEVTPWKSSSSGISDTVYPCSLPISSSSETDLDVITDAMAEDGFKPFPLICKPVAACGSIDSHRMAIVFDAAGLAQVPRPCIVQPFINHGARMYKIYAVDRRVSVLARASVRNLTSTDVSSSGKAVFFQSQKLSENLPSSLRGPPSALAGPSLTPPSSPPPPPGKSLSPARTAPWSKSSGANTNTSNRGVAFRHPRPSGGRKALISVTPLLASPPPPQSPASPSSVSTTSSTSSLSSGYGSSVSAPSTPSPPPPTPPAPSSSVAVGGAQPQPQAPPPPSSSSVSRLAHRSSLASSASSASTTSDTSDVSSGQLPPASSSRQSLMSMMSATSTSSLSSTSSILTLDGTEVGNSHRHSGSGAIPTRTIFEGVVRSVGDVLGLTLFGVDMITDADTGRHYIIDVNYFPGYKGVESFQTVLVDHIKATYQRAVKSAKEAQAKELREQELAAAAAAAAGPKVVGPPATISIARPSSRSRSSSRRMFS